MMRTVRTVRVVHTTAGNEAAGMAMLFVLGVIVALAVGAYTLMHRIVSEHDIPMDQLAISWSEPERHRYDRTYGPDAIDGPDALSTSYELAVDIRNNSKFRLYSLDYEATLHACEFRSQQAEDCPIIGTSTGRISPDLVSRGHGIQKTTANYSNAWDHIGYGRLVVRWTAARGVRD